MQTRVDLYELPCFEVSKTIPVEADKVKGICPYGRLEDISRNNQGIFTIF